MLQPTQTSWVILAGGRATRMGGHDKGLVQLNGQPLIEHVYQRLAPQASRIYINANRNIERYQQYAPVFTDTLADYPGPLGGIQAGLEFATTDWVGFVPCDCPQIDRDLVQRFCSAAHSQLDILIAHDGQHQQPVFTLCHQRLLPTLSAFLARGDRKIALLYQECRSAFVDFSDSPECFVNLNTPQELAQFGHLTHD